MRKQVLTLIATAALGLCPLAASAQTDSPPAGVRVAIINMQRAIMECAEGKKAITDLQAKYQPTQEAINKLQQEVSALQDQLQRQATTLSADEQERLSRELQQKQTDLQRKTEDAQNDFKYDRQDVVTRIGKKMVQVINQYAKQHGFDLVMDSGSEIYYAADGVDITDAIIKLYDTQFRVQAGSAAAPTTKKAAAP